MILSVKKVILSLYKIKYLEMQIVEMNIEILILKR